MSDDIEKQLAEIEAMFVQVAREYTRDGDKVSFHGLSPATLFFSDRPQRVVGHLTAQQFVDEWDKGENSFAQDPPNGVISFLEAGDEAPEDAIVVLRDPALDGDTITYSIERARGLAAGERQGLLGVHRPVRPAALTGVPRRHEPPGKAARTLSFFAARRPD